MLVRRAAPLWVAMSSNCAWPCPFCTLKIPHGAGFRGGVQSALTLAQQWFQIHRINEFQLIMVEAAVMDIMSRSEEFASYSDEQIRTRVLESRKHILDGFIPPVDTATTPAQVPVDDADPPHPTTSSVPEERTHVPPPPLPPTSSQVDSDSDPPWHRGGDAAVGNAASSSAGGLPSRYKWQVKMGKFRKENWKDASADLNWTLETAYLSGVDSTTWQWKGEMWYYTFRDAMIQTSPNFMRERPIRRIRVDDA